MIHQPSQNFVNPQLATAAVAGYKFSWFDWFCLWYPPGWLIFPEYLRESYEAEYQKDFSTNPMMAGLTSICGGQPINFTLV